MYSRIAIGAFSMEDLTLRQGDKLGVDNALRTTMYIVIITRRIIIIIILLGEGGDCVIGVMYPSEFEKKCPAMSAGGRPWVHATVESRLD
jgi:hypothetical protein